MYKVGDFVIYGHEGVCRIEEISALKMSGFDKKQEYYRLMPQHHSGTIYVPVEGTKIVMRLPISQTELEALLEEYAQLPLLEDIPAEGRQAGEYYRQLLAAHSCRELLRLCKTMYARQRTKTRSRNKINATDQRSWKAASDMLNDEFSFTWGISPEEAGKRLKEFFERSL